MSRQSLLVVASLLLAAVGVWAGLGWWKARQDAAIASLPAVPEGRWNALRPEEAVSREEDERARIMSLPYVAGRRRATERFGVTVHDLERSWQGVNLYVSGHGPEAVLLDMGGTVLHRWRLPYDEAFGAESATESTIYWRRAQLLPDGDLLAIFQAGGMVKVDPNSRLLWALDEGFYNDLEVLPDGTILAIGKAARVVPEINSEDRVLEEFIVRISPEGEVLERLSLLGAFLESSFREMLDPMNTEGDIFHANTVEWLDGSQKEVSPLLRRGNLLVSLREVDVVAIVDPASGVVEWAQRGPWDAQHQPTLVEGGRLLIFDNRGRSGFSRVVELDLANGELGWRYPSEEAIDDALASPEGGSAQRLPGGTTLITESERGRALEVTAQGDIVWEFMSPHRAGPQNNLVATLFEVVRLPRETGEIVTRRAANE